MEKPLYSTQFMNSKLVLGNETERQFFRQYEIREVPIDHDRKMSANIVKVEYFLGTGITGSDGITLEHTSLRFSPIGSSVIREPYMLNIATTRKSEDGGKDIFIPVTQEPVAEVMAGPCMFGATGVRAVTRQGETLFVTDPSSRLPTESLIENIEIDAGPHPYEENMISTWQTMTPLLKQLGQGTLPEIVIQIPEEQYLLYGL